MSLNKKEMGLKIKEARKIKSSKLGTRYTGAMLAEALNISRSYLGDIESGRIYPNYTLLTDIAEACDVPLSFFDKSSILNAFAGPGKLLKRDNVNLKELNKINTECDFETIPIVGSIRAGQPMLAEDNLQGYIPIIKNSLKSDSVYFGLRVKGDSMNLEFDEGTILVIEKTPCIENGEIGVVRIDGLEATVKKIVLNAEMITLIPMSNNPEHIPQMYNLKTDDVEIIGKVKQAIKTY